MIAIRPFTSPTMVSGGLTFTGCSGTPTETEVVRVRLLLGACCGVEFLVIKVAVGILVAICSLWCMVSWVDGGVRWCRTTSAGVCVVRVEVVVFVVVVVKIVTKKEK